MNNIRDLLQWFTQMCRLHTAIVEELEDLNRRVGALEQTAKLRDASLLDLKKDVQDLKLLSKRGAVL